jgi:hypothetical protein
MHSNADQFLGMTGLPYDIDNGIGITFAASLLWSSSAIWWKVRYSPTDSEYRLWQNTPYYTDLNKEATFVKVACRLDYAYDTALEYLAQYLIAAHNVLPRDPVIIAMSRRSITPK